MQQFYKDFIINGTKDRAFSSELDKEIIGNINNFIFGEISGDRIRDIIEDYTGEISRNRIATVIDSKMGLEWVVDAFTRMNNNKLEFYTNAGLTSNNSLFIISSMQSLVEINDYTDLIKDIALAENEEMSNKDILSRFNSLIAFKDIFTTKSEDCKDQDYHRVYTKRMQIDVPGETNCYIYKIQLRVVISDTRVIYNHYCVLRNDIDYSLELLDKEYGLGLLKENNKTIKAMYAKPEASLHSAPLFVSDVVNLKEEIGNKYTFAITNALNKNNALFRTLDGQLKELESKLGDKLKVLDISANHELNSSRDFIVSAAKRIYSLNKNLNLKELDIAISTVIAAAINFNVVERNIKYKALDLVGSISASSSISTIKLCMQNMPLDPKDDMSILESEFNTLRNKKILEITEVSKGLLNGLKVDLMNMLNNFMLTFEDLIIKSMYEGNVGLFFKAPEDKEDKISMLIAARSITLNKNIDSFDAASMFGLDKSSRRISNLTSNIIYNTIIELMNDIIGFIDTKVGEEIDSNSEKAIEDINSLELEEVLGIKQ